MRPYAAGSSLFAGLFTFLVAACSPAPEGPSTPPSPAKPPVEAVSKAPPGGKTTVTLLYTTDEHGWIEATSKDGVKRGGAAELLGRLVATEGHCPGPLPGDGAPAPGSGDACKAPGTILLSGGDNFTGPAITTYFMGEPMAEAMRRLGYAASAFGNHEFDFGRDRFPKLRDGANLGYVAANVKIADARLAAELDIKPFRIFERRGVKIGVVGLAAGDTLKAALPERFVGMTFEPAEPSIDRAVREARGAGADVVVVTAHECPDVLLPIVEKHPEWRLSFVGGGHCHKKYDERAGSVPVLSPDWRMHQYARVAIGVNLENPPEKRVPEKRVVSVESSIVDVTSTGELPADPPLARMVAAWKEKVDRALGQVIGHTAEGIGPEEVVGQMVSDAWLEEIGGDVAIMNRGGVRQTIPKGPITHATLWGVLPFDNRIVKVSIPGDVLGKDLEMPKIIVSGAKKGADGKWTVGGKPIDPKRQYTVIITDFMYTGGDGAEFGAQDPKGVGTGIQWRDPVIGWIAKKKSTPEAPLEKKSSPRPLAKDASKK
jgi:5'-nucleotidase / UDP-sugar diphosphatase